MSTSHDLLDESPSTRTRARNDGLGEATRHEVLHNITTDRASESRTSRQGGGAEARKRVTPDCWAVGVPYSAATARNRPRNGADPQRLYAAPSSRPRSHVPTHCSCSHAGSPRSSVGSRVARRLPGRHSLVAASRCAAGLDFVGRSTSGRPPPWCPQGGLLPASTCWTRTLQYVGRLSHDRTTERHWQRLGSHRATVPKEVPRSSSTPAAAHATSPRAAAVRLSSVPFLGGGRPGWSGGLSLGPLPPRTMCRRHRRRWCA